MNAKILPGRISRQVDSEAAAPVGSNPSCCQKRIHILIGLKRLISTTGLLVGLAAIAILSSCGNSGGSGLKRYDLFKIPLGTLPGELDWFYRDGFRMAGTADIQTRDGLVFLSGGGAGKVMVFNSYGDLLTYVYDPGRNPAPAADENGETNSSVSSWSFRTPKNIAAFDGGFLVEDGVEQERRVADSEFNAYYDRVVLRFDQDGNYLGHLGREGFGGSPFPYISSIDVREDGGIVVTSRVPGAWMSYWYNRDGHPVTTIRIREDQLPGKEDGSNVAVYAVRPDPVEWSLHVRLDVYPDATNGDRPDPRLYTLDLSTLEYSEPIVLTYNEGNIQKGVPSIPPEYLGTTVDGSHMMISPEGPDLYRLTLVDGQGRIIQNRRLKVDGDATVYRRFKLQNNGLLTGIFFGSEEASVAWWRVDKIIGNER